MSELATCVRIPIEWRAQIEYVCQMQGLTMSEWLRQAISAALLGTGGTMSDGYVAGRAMGLNMARYALESAAKQLPSSYEEAAAWLQAMAENGGV